MRLLRELLNRAGSDERGFTLIELLVVMLVLANLAAIALPSFMTQKTKARDANAKETAHTAQVAMETCAVANLGLYTSCDETALRAIAPTLPASGLAIVNTGGGYSVTVTAAISKNTYSIVRSSTGQLTFPCKPSSSDRGGCPGAGTAAGTWG